MRWQVIAFMRDSGAAVRGLQFRCIRYAREDCAVICTYPGFNGCQIVDNETHFVVESFNDQGVRSVHYPEAVTRSVV